jgi:hypothetical protein
MASMSPQKGRQSPGHNPLSRESWSNLDIISVCGSMPFEIPIIWPRVLLTLPLVLTVDAPNTNQTVYKFSSPLKHTIQPSYTATCFGIRYRNMSDQRFFLLNATTCPYRLRGPHRAQLRWPDDVTEDDMYSGPSSYDRLDIRRVTTKNLFWLTTKVLSYDPHAGQRPEMRS